MTTTLTITINARTIERIIAYARYMTEWGELASAHEGRQPSAPWSIEEAARALIERGANDWEKELRELTGLTSTSLDEVAHAAIEQNPPSS